MKCAKLITLFVFLSFGIEAQLLVDPTKPPRDRTLETEDGSEEIIETRVDASGIPNARVTAIFVSNEARYAIINGDTVFEGETWRNVKVAKVNLSSVVLQNENNKKEIKINNINIIKESAHDY